MKFFIFFLSLISCSHVCASDKLINLYKPSSSGAISTDEIILDLLTDKLPDYKLKKLNVGLERSLKLMTQNNEDSCIRNMRKTPQRESALYFSYPQTLFLGLKAYLSPRASLIFRTKSSISIDDFIVKNKLIIGVDKERSYSSGINAQILKLPNQNKYIKEGSASEERMAQMLFSNRIDVWLEHQTVMEVYKEKYKERYLGDNQILSLSIIGADDLVTGHIACNKTAKNKLFITAINQSLLQLYQEKSYYEAHTLFIHKNLEKKFNQSFNDFLVKFKRN
jgi:uncharacterized protein (TIGR02285 family)